MEFFENAFSCFRVDGGKTELFENDDVFSIGSSLSARKKMAGYGNFMSLLCIKRQGNMLGCQMHVKAIVLIRACLHGGGVTR